MYCIDSSKNLHYDSKQKSNYKTGMTYLHLQIKFLLQKLLIQFNTLLTLNRESCQPY